MPRPLSRVLLFLLVTTSPAIGAGAAPSARDDYKKNCVDCHGADGRSQTRLGRKSGAKDLTDKAGMGKLTDEDVFKTIKVGRRNAKGEEKMEGFGDRLSDEQVAALVIYVRAFVK